MNAVIGIAREYCATSGNGLDEMLRYELLYSHIRISLEQQLFHNFANLFSEISSRLFDLGAAVATPVQASSTRKKAYTEV